MANDEIIIVCLLPDSEIMLYVDIFSILFKQCEGFT